MELNDRQRQAVETLEGPLLIVAGAGSGKTRVLTHRIANLISHRKTQADEILAVTFTNKAAREMKERVEKILKRDVRSLWISTFHSSCVRILRQEIERLGYSPQFVIYDDQDQLTVIKNCLKELHWDEKMLSPRAAQSRISHAKNLGLTPQKLLKKTLSS
ncbi:MAG: UvrD-helicase domain-containing protein, partial [Deltaproteobacteria bacterium]|nr:UvrD-helicase domain-containing protein [Deltaproteobacteria bacterium]